MQMKYHMEQGSCFRKVLIYLIKIIFFTMFVPSLVKRYKYSPLETGNS